MEIIHAENGHLNISVSQHKRKYCSHQTRAGCYTKTETENKSSRKLKIYISISNFIEELENKIRETPHILKTRREVWTIEEKA